MKYDEQIFNLSQKAYTKIANNNAEENEEIKNKQKKLLKLMFEKFQSEFEKQKDNPSGIMRVKFLSKFWSDFNDGYREIDELVNSNNFSTFASEYCIYIGDVEHRCDEHYTGYYEIIWDYKTYFEELMHDKTIIRTKQKPNENNCKDFEHDFSNWQEVHTIGIEKVGNEVLPPGYTRWVRTCNKCGFVQSTSVKPKELEEKELVEQISVLTMRLNSIRKDN